MQTTLYTNPSIFDSLANEWQNLMMGAVNAPIFMTVAYQKVWWEHHGNNQLRVLTIREEESKQLVGVAPLFIEDNQLKFVGCVDVSDYLDFLVHKNYVTEVYTEIFNFINTHLKTEWQSAYFCSLAHQSPTSKIISNLALTAGLTSETVIEEVCPVITLADTWDGYLAAINKKQRHEIKRKLRKAENTAETRWFVIDSVADLSQEIVDIFIELHQKSTKDKEEFWDETMVDFFKALIKNFAQMGWLKLYFLEINGQTAATLLCFDYNNEILVYNSGFDPQQFAHLSPGNIIVSYSIEHAIKLGRIRYDFLRGDEVYKFRFGAIAEDVQAVKINK